MTHTLAARTLAARTLPFALAALLTAAMVAGVSALAGHQVRVARAAVEADHPDRLATAQLVTIVGHRSADL